MYNKKEGAAATLFDMEVRYQSELNWNLTKKFVVLFPLMSWEPPQKKRDSK